MLAMTSIIVGKCFYLLSNFLYSFYILYFYILSGPPNVVEPRVTSPSTSPLDGPESINNALINALKKLMQCINE